MVECFPGSTRQAFHIKLYIFRIVYCASAVSNREPVLAQELGVYGLVIKTVYQEVISERAQALRLMCLGGLTLD